MSRTKITPEMAQTLLDANAANQRKVKKIKVAKFAEEMLNGIWLYNGESVIVTETGKLIDGQHRLLAVIESGVTIEVALITDVPDEQDGVDTFLTINTENRSNGDALYIAGFKTESTLIARSMSLIAAFEEQRLAQKPSGIKYLNPEMVSIVRTFTEKRVLDIIERARTLQSRCNLLSLNYWIVLVQVMRKLPDGNAFMEQIAECKGGGEDGDPVNALQSFFERYEGKGGGAGISKVKWIAIFKAYKAYSTNSPVKHLRVNVGMPVEYPSGYPDYVEQ